MSIFPIGALIINVLPGCMCLKYQIYKSENEGRECSLFIWLSERCAKMKGEKCPLKWDFRKDVRGLAKLIVLCLLCIVFTTAGLSSGYQVKVKI